MASTRVRTGFHRLAIVLAVGFLIPAVIALANAGFIKIMYANADTGAPLTVAALCFAAAVIFYVAIRAIGWIVEGFIG